MIPASKLQEKHHYPDFPEYREYGIDLSLVDAELIHVLQHLRTDSRIPITPSPARGAWGRLTGSTGSRHYAIDRLSDAGDIFPQRGHVLDLWTAAQAFRPRMIGGIGLYADTNGPDGQPWPMMHLDLRPERLMWASEKIDGLRKYYYQPINSSFWRVVERIIAEERRYQ